MIYRFDQIRTLNLEGTAVCNAKCPMCTRLMIPGGPNRLESMPSSKMAGILSSEIMPQIQTLLWCGNYGDPCTRVDLPILIRIAEDNLRSQDRHRIVVETNGGMYRPKYWHALAKSSKNLVVVFNIDGLRDTLGKYRVNVDYDTVIDNASAYIKAGGYAVWAFIPFAHNEHQVEEARRLSKKYGFKEFQVRVTDRFLRNNGTRLLKWGDLEPATAPEYQHRPNLTADQFLEEMRTCKVSCRASCHKSIYIDHSGLVFPCCFAASVYEGKSDLGTELVREKLLSLPEAEYPSILLRPLREIVEGEFFRWFASTFNDPPNRPTVCSAVCGIGNFKTVRSDQ